MGKSLKSDILLGKKTYLMIKAIKKDPIFIKKAINIAKIDFSKGICKIRDFMINTKIKENAEKDISIIIKKADNKLNSLDINKNKLLYFSDLIRNRGN